MFSQRSHITLLHTPGAMGGGFETLQHHAPDRKRRCQDGRGLDKLKAEVPHLNYSQSARFRISGAVVQKRAGTARHDAVVWGYARAADARGVDIIQQCEVTGFARDGDAITSIDTTRGAIRAKKFCLAVAGNTSRLWSMAGLNGLPIESHNLQAFVARP